MKKNMFILIVLTTVLILFTSTPAFAWYGSLKYAKSEILLGN